MPSLSPLVTGHSPALRMAVADEGSLVSAVLIYGSAIKTHANFISFNYLQFSNRR